jgi:hypothetical protein
MRWTFFIAIMVVFNVSFCVAQTPKGQTRVFAVKGSVVDRKGNPFGFALVCLKDTRSRMLRMKRAERDGHFTITALNAQLDYEIYAEWDDLASESVFISGSQKGPEVFITLRLSRNQENHYPFVGYV